MTNNKSVKPPIVLLKLPRAVPELVTYAQHIVTSMTGNTLYPTPSPTLVLVTAAIVALHDAESAALARTKGAVAIRDDKRVALVTLLKQLRAYVQTVADANVEIGVAAIESAGFPVRKPVVRKPRVFTALPGAVSGSVRLIAAQAARRASYDWEYSVDGGKTWTVLPSTLQAKTTVLGLTPGTTVEFRYRGVTRTGESDWSQPLSLLVK